MIYEFQFQSYQQRSSLWCCPVRSPSLHSMHGSWLHESQMNSAMSNTIPRNMYTHPHTISQMILILGTSPMLGPSEYYNASNFTYIDHRIIKVTNFGCYKWIHRILERYISKKLLFTIYIKYSTCWVTIKLGRLRG